MTVPQKAAKKAPAKSAPKHDEGKDLRRAYEHQGRVAVLRSALGKHTSDIDLLEKLSEQELARTHFKDAADLLRAAEHLGFGLLASAKPSGISDDKLTANVEAEFEHKLQSAQEHWQQNEELASLYEKTIHAAQSALNEGAYRKALELARAAEALAHVHLHHNQESERAA